METPHTIELVSLLDKKANPLGKEPGRQVILERVKAILFEAPPQLRFVTEYHLTQMLAKAWLPITNVYFSFARSLEHGFRGNWVLMHSRSAWNLAAASNFLGDEFPGIVFYPLSDEEYPQIDYGSPFHYALGPYRICTDIIRKDLSHHFKEMDMRFFLAPQKNSQYHLLGLPETVAKVTYPGHYVGSWVNNRMLEYMQSWSYIPMTNREYSVLEEETAYYRVNNYWRARGNFDRGYFKSYTVRQEILEKLYVPSEFKAIREELGTNYLLIDSPLDQLGYLYPRTRAGVADQQYRRVTRRDQRRILDEELDNHQDNLPSKRKQNWLGDEIRDAKKSSSRSEQTMEDVDSGIDGVKTEDNELN